MDVKNYSAEEILKNGLSVTVRAIRPSDRKEFLTALKEIDDRSIYLRFFTLKKNFSDKEVTDAIEVDFIHTVALVVCIQDKGTEKIIGGCRYIVLGNLNPPKSAEVAFMVRKGYQGLGLAGKMLGHLAIIAREKAITEFQADVLSENTGMLTVFKRSGLPITFAYDSGVAHVTLSLAGH